MELKVEVALFLMELLKRINFKYYHTLGVSMVFKWRCEVCGKVIESLYETQFNINKQHHLDKHKRGEQDEDTTNK